MPESIISIAVIPEDSANLARVRIDTAQIQCFALIMFESHKDAQEYADSLADEIKHRTGQP